MRILLTNDDGIRADGIWALRDAVADLGEIVVVAPESEQSAAGHALTLTRPLRVRAAGTGTFAVDGTPTDCILLAVRGVPGLIDFHPDLILAGINHGPNLGDDVTYSGTVAAAFEGHLLGIPSIAFSLVGTEQFPSAARAARCLIEQLLANGPLGAMLLSVNIPDLPYGELRGFRWTRLGKRVYEDVVVEGVDPRGRPYYWIGGNPSWDPAPDSDMSAVGDREISITPLHLALTDEAMLARMRGLALRLDSADEP